MLFPEWLPRPGLRTQAAGRQVLRRLQNFSLQRKENRPCVCVGSAWGRLQEPHVCTIKSWLPPEGSQHKLKEAGPCRKPNKGQLGFFFFNLQAFRSCLEQSLLGWGSPDTVSLTACFVPRTSAEFSFLFLPSVNQKRKGSGSEHPKVPLWQGRETPANRCPAARVRARPREDGAGPGCSRVHSIMRNAGSYRSGFPGLMESGLL